MFFFHYFTFHTYCNQRMKVKNYASAFSHKWKSKIKRHIFGEICTSLEMFSETLWRQSETGALLTFLPK